MAFKTDEEVQRDYKEMEQKEKEWWGAYVRIREDLSLAKTNIKRLGDAINEIESMIHSFHSSVNESFDETNNKINEIKESINKNYDKISDVESEIKDKASIVEEKLDNNHSAILEVVSNIEKNKAAIDEVKTEVLKVEPVLIEKVKQDLFNSTTSIESTLNTKINEIKSGFENLVRRLNNDINMKWYWLLGTIGGAFVILAIIVTLYKFLG